MRKGTKFKHKEKGFIIVISQKKGDYWRCRKEGKKDKMHKIREAVIRQYYKEV